MSRRRKKKNKKIILIASAVLIIYCIVFIIAMMQIMGGDSGVSVRLGLAAILLHILAIVIIAFFAHDNL